MASLCFVWLVGWLLILAGCGGGGGGSAASSTGGSGTPARVIVSPSSASVVVGQSQTFGATVSDAAGATLTDAAVTWSSDRTDIATIAATGIATAKAAGTATITAMAGGVSGTATLTVFASPVGRVEVLPLSAVCGRGGTQRFTTVVYDLLGNPVSGYTPAWTSSLTTIATVDTSGLVTANATTTGQTVITATASGVSGQATFTVTASNPAVTVSAVTILPSSATIPILLTQQFVALATNTAGDRACESEAPFTWATGSAAVATVSASGLVTGQGLGQTTVTATTGGVSGSATVTVGLFRTALTYPAGVSPSAILASDFTGDGRADLAIANAGGNDIAVLSTKTGAAGNNDPFTAAPAFSRVGRGPFGVASGRFDQADLLVDLVTADQASDTLSILLGLSGGTFASGPYTTLSAGAGPAAVAGRDFTGDGRDDLAVVTLGGDELRVYAQIGTGLFSLVSQRPTGGVGPLALVAGRFDADANLDLAVVNATSGTVTVFRGDGAGGMALSATVVTGTNPSALAAADFTGDGKQDLAVVNRLSSTLAVLTGDGAGGFTVTSTTSNIGSLPTAVAAADLNGDGKQDLTVANFGSNTVTVFLGKGDGTFLAPISHPVGAGPTALAVGDFNGDGRLDVASANAFGNSVSVLLAAP